MKREELSEAELAHVEIAELYGAALPALPDCLKRSIRLGIKLIDQLDKTITVEMPEPSKLDLVGDYRIYVTFMDKSDRDKAEQAIVAALEALKQTEEAV
jgi:hypothetical protein